jgi:hypothetical protein
MVFGQADGPLLERHLDVSNPHAAVGIEVLSRRLRPNTNAPA